MPGARERFWAALKTPCCQREGNTFRAGRERYQTTAEGRGREGDREGGREGWRRDQQTNGGMWDERRWPYGWENRVLSTSVLRGQLNVLISMGGWPSWEGGEEEGGGGAIWSVVGYRMGKAREEQLTSA
jgi:hypothetical protein